MNAKVAIKKTPLFVLQVTLNDGERLELLAMLRSVPVYPVFTVGSALQLRETIRHTLLGAL